MSSKVYIGAGSNLGNRINNLKASWDKLQSILLHSEHSSIWETKPLIVEDQPNFLNMVFAGEFEGSSLDLLDKLQAIEFSLGRNRDKEISKGPRTIDLDILLFGNETIRSDKLDLPHPGILQRAFVLTPLLEVYDGCDQNLNGFRDSLNNLADQGILCLKKQSDQSFWKSGEQDE